MTPAFLIALAIVAYAATRVLNRTRPASSQRVDLWQKSLGLAALFVAVFILLNPDFIALGLLGDTAFVDLLVLLIGLQLRAIGAQAWCALAELPSRVMWWFMTPRLSYLVVLALFVAIANVISTSYKFLQRLTS